MNALLFMSSDRRVVYALLPLAATPVSPRSLQSTQMTWSNSLSTNLSSSIGGRDLISRGRCEKDGSDGLESPRAMAALPVGRNDPFEPLSHATLRAFVRGFFRDATAVFFALGAASTANGNAGLGCLAVRRWPWCSWMRAASSSIRKRASLSFWQVLKVRGNRFRCHGHSVAELSPSKPSNFVHSLTIHRPPRRDGVLGRLLQPHVDELAPLHCSPSSPRETLIKSSLSTGNIDKFVPA